MMLFGHENFCAAVQGPEGIRCNCRVSDREVPVTASHPENLGMPPKRIVLSTPPVTCAFGTFTVDANGQLYEMTKEMDGPLTNTTFPNPTGRYVLSRVTFVEGK